MFNVKIVSQSSVATYGRWGGNLGDVYMGNFLKNHLVKELWKSVHICESYYRWVLFQAAKPTEKRRKRQTKTQ